MTGELQWVGMRKTRNADVDVQHRRRRVLERIAERGEMRIADLADEFDVSLMTMHRDLDELQNRRTIDKLRGVVRSLPAVTMESATRFREQQQMVEKEALAQAAVVEIVPGMTVMLDDSTTLFPLARLIAKTGGVTVVTNSVAIARLAGEDGRVDVVLAGGTYRDQFESCTGPQTIRTLSGIRADLLFASTTAVFEGNLYNPFQEYAEVKLTMFEAAQRRVLVLDHSKFGRTATFNCGHASAYDLLVTDAATPASELSAISTGITVVPPP